MKKISLFAALLCLFVAGPAHAVTVEEVTGSKSGVKAWLVEDHHLPIVAMRFAFTGGSEQDPVAKQGLATLTMNALTEGAGPYNADAFQKELAGRSIALGFSAERDVLAGGLKCLSVDKAKAFDLLHLALTAPRFEAKDIERLRAQQLSAVRQQFSEPDWQARYALFSHIFAGHPYGERHLGSAATLAAISRGDIRSFATTHMARDNVTVAVAGDMTVAELAAALDKIFADLPAKAQLAAIPEAVEPRDATTILVRRDGTQSNLLFALPGPKRSDPDWYAADIANYILGGGGFSSRLMQEIRDKKGLTYGIDTGLAPADHDGLILGQAAVDNPKVSEVLDVLRETMEKFRDNGVTPQEVAAAKDYLSGSEALALTSTDKIAEVLVAMQRDKLGRDYLDRYADLIRGVTQAAITRAIDRWFDPDHMTLVMVGLPQGIAANETHDMVRQ
ncbi:MAG: pitrilysin family protein [Alphaproteobacteria bacterium]|nr:pitrilysin family protein [Alphaproteobacteria bacterium]